MANEPVLANLGLSQGAYPTCDGEFYLISNPTTPLATITFTEGVDGMHRGAIAAALTGEYTVRFVSGGNQIAKGFVDLKDNTEEKTVSAERPTRDTLLENCAGGGTVPPTVYPRSGISGNTIAFGELLRMAKRYNADDQTQFGSTIFEDMVSDAYQEVWSSQRWPFQIKEGSIRVYPSFAVGQVTATENSVNVQFDSAAINHADWRPTDWTYPCRLAIANGRGDYMLQSLTEGGAGVMDAIFSGESGTYGFDMNFCTYDLPNDFAEMNRVERYLWFWDMQPVSYADWLTYRTSGVWGGIARRFAVVPSDGSEPGKIYFYPGTTENETMRYQYWAKPEYGRLYRTGTATATKDSAAVTGVGTEWDSLDYSVVGMFAEFPYGNAAPRWSKGKVLSVASDTELTLQANWRSATATSKAYMLSTQLGMPNYMLPCLRDLIRCKVMTHRGELAAADRALRDYQASVRKAKGDAWPKAVPIPCQSTFQEGLWQVTPPIQHTIINNNV